MKNKSTETNSQLTQVEQTIDSVAQFITQKHLEAPAVFFLELQKPLTSLTHTGLTIMQPLAAPLFGSERCSRFSRLFSNRENIEKLICKVETMTKSRK